ncbi:hypothetical protein [Alloacidobacterium sp.]|uniref:hypothetical protein n=1 Tax=Alloacidobacterium sp. TaxID=2951999 RepID=UPI002D587E3B|nr:hypothetical protein [Alloacidobacterium sp.]HYK34582.1 hypothetical protein [Alloacidobacterium sp.]
MARFSGLLPPAALFPLLAAFASAQNAPPAGQSSQQAEVRNLETETVFSPIEKLQFFTLEHRSPAQIEPTDADLLKNRNRDLLNEAEFYGYDMSTAGWNYEQSVCSLMPDYVLVRYTSKDAAGADSIFTALVPRSGGRVLAVPVLSHGATRFKPAPVDPRNFQIFSQVVPADVAKTNSGPDGKWLLLSVCYAEMTGARPQVPNHPSMDVRMIKAPPPTLRISVSGQDHEVRFVDPISPVEYRLWDISYDANGHVIGVSDDRQSFGQPIVKTIPEPTPKVMPQPPASSIKDTSSPQPAAKPVQPQ